MPRAVRPTEHGAWAWLGVPLVSSLALAPRASTALAASAVVAGFLAAQGLGRALGGSRAARAPALVALLAAQVAGALAIVHAPAPGPLLATLLGGALVGFGITTRVRGRMPRGVAFELAAIALFVALGAGLALSGGAEAGRVACSAAVLGAWFVTGLWWIKGALARVLSHRRPWAAGRWVAFGTIAVSLALGIAEGHVWVGALPLAYGVRVRAHAPPERASDARRVGLTELAWSVVIALAAALA